MKRMLLFFATLWLGIMGASAQSYHYDVNNDGEVNINDVVALVNKILGKLNPGEVAVGEAVDLGLPSGTKWAKYNIGASKPEEFGEYLAWGELNEKSYYGPSTYQYARQEDNGWYDKATGKYYSFISIGSDICGTQYDVACMRWGGKWRMPTVVNYNELINNCDFEWTSVNGVQGGKFTSKINGKSIFLPAAGDNSFGEVTSVGKYGNYWLSSMTNDIRYSHHMTFSSGGVFYGGILRSCGYNVRPVYVY